MEVLRLDRAGGRTGGPRAAFPPDPELEASMSRPTNSLSRRTFLSSTVPGALGAAVALGAAGKILLADPPQGKPSPWKSVSDRKIRVGVVGGGFGAAFPWHQHPNCVVEAVSDLQADRRNGLMRTFNCQKSYDSLEKLVLDDKIDAVAVFTDAPSHGRHVALVMNHGKHCFSAVPACMNLEDAQKMKEIKEKTGLKYMMAESSYYHGEVIQWRNACRQGARGAYWEGQYYHNDVTHVPSWQGWRLSLPPMFYPTHASAYYVGIMTGKRLTKVTCLGLRGEGEEWQKNRYDNNPFVNESAMFHTSEGTMFRCNVFWKCNAGGEYGGVIWVTDPHVGQYPSTVSLPAGMDPGGHGGSAGPLVNEFLTALLENREPAVDIYESLAMTVPGIVAHQSALKNGEMLDVPSFDKTA
jgi:predicted dehydrogenase